MRRRFTYPAALVLLVVSTVVKGWNIPSRNRRQNTRLSMASKFAQPAFSKANRDVNKNTITKNKEESKTTKKTNTSNEISKQSNQRNEQPKQRQEQQLVIDSIHNLEPTQSQPQQQQHQQQQHKSDSRFMEMHQQRVRTAGRVGTKRFVNPCLVFLGNLPFNTTSAELQTWLCDQMATPASLLLHQPVCIIRDWKTGQSKGYAFVTFAAAHLATVAMDQLHLKAEYQGRVLTVQQGQKKPDPNLVLLMEQKKLKKQQRKLTIDEQAEQVALEILEPEEYALLARLDPDLLVNAQLDESFDEDDEDGYDGDYVEFQDDDDDENSNNTTEETPANRQQRREAAKSKKRKKAPHKGFGQTTK